MIERISAKEEVLPVNDKPTAKDDSAETLEDTPVNIKVLANDNDIDGNTLTITQISSPTQSGGGRTTLNSNNGTITYTPNANYNGQDSFTYTISDGIGGTAAAKVTVTVTPVNDPTVAVDDYAVTLEDKTVTANVLSNVFDDDGDPLTITSATTATGTATINPASPSTGGKETITYTPPANFNGAATVNYSISDGTGSAASAQLFITVKPVNDDPVAVDDRATTKEDTTLSGLNLLGNDTDLDGDPVQFASISASHGSVLINSQTNTITYTPTDNFNGVDVIEYSITDGNGGSASAVARITVTPVNDPPVADGQTVSTNFNTPAEITLTASDLDGQSDIKSYTIVSPPTQGTLSGTAPNVIYTPNSDYSGPDSFTFKVVDGSSVDSNIANVGIIVNIPTESLKGTVSAGGAQISTATNFGMNVQSNGTLIVGQIEYQDKAAVIGGKTTTINFHGDSFATFTKSLDIKKATITGKGSVNGTPGYSFTINVEDNAEPGVNKDKFTTTIKELSQTKGGLLTTGNIQIHKL